MRIYLVRHAAAVEQTDGLEDGIRWLTPKGRKTMQKAAIRLHRRKARPELIITSPLTRAVQTAELLMNGIGKHAVLSADNRLAPEAVPQHVVELIRSHDTTDSIMLVGHEPLLSQTAALLLGRTTVAGLGKAACLCLELRDKPDKPAKFCWYAMPGNKTVTTARKALGPDA